MAPGRSRRNFNLGNWLVLLGFGGLGLTFWFPVASATRSARAEERAADVAALLLREAVAMQPFDPAATAGPLLPQVLLARLQRACAAALVFGHDLELAPGAAPTTGLLLRNKHYLFAVEPTPPARGTPAAPDSVPPLTVLAWPLDLTSPGHCVFSLPEGDEAAFTRNLQGGYTGARRPDTDAGRRRQDPRPQRWAWRGIDDERWIALRGPAWPTADDP